MSSRFPALDQECPSRRQSCKEKVRGGWEDAGDRQQGGAKKGWRDKQVVREKCPMIQAPWGMAGARGDESRMGRDSKWGTCRHEGGEVARGQVMEEGMGIASPPPPTPLCLPHSCNEGGAENTT